MLCESCFLNQISCSGFVSSNGYNTWRTPIPLGENLNLDDQADIHIPTEDTGCNGYQPLNPAFDVEYEAHLSVGHHS